MKNLKAVALALAGLCAGSVALADTQVPGTKVSYKVSSKTDSEGRKINTSMIFVDASNEPSGKTYLAFMCGEYADRLYTNVTLGTAKEVNDGTIGGMSYRMDNGAFKPLNGALRLDNQTGKRSSVNIYDDMSHVFLTAEKSVTIRVNRTGSSAVGYTFPVKGLAEAFRAVNNCE